MIARAVSSKCTGIAASAFLRPLRGELLLLLVGVPTFFANDWTILTTFTLFLNLADNCVRGDAVGDLTTKFSPSAILLELADGENFVVKSPTASPRTQLVI